MKGFWCQRNHRFFTDSSSKWLPVYAIVEILENTEGCFALSGYIATNRASKLENAF